MYAQKGIHTCNGEGVVCLRSVTSTRNISDCGLSAARDMEACRLSE